MLKNGVANKLKSFGFIDDVNKLVFTGGLNDIDKVMKILKKNKK